MALYGQALANHNLNQAITNKPISSSTGIDWGGLINSGVGALSNVYDNYINAQMQAAGMANAASAAAQQQQFAYNMEAMSQQIAANTALMREAMGYNMQSAAQTNALQYQIQQEAMGFNAAEAQKNRDWQELMSNTAYQRAVNDMRKAGINPILAATNGGATVGSGATASISSAKAAQASGMSGASVGLPSVGNYTGQGYHLSDTFATFGAILGTVGNILSGLQSNGAGKGVQNYIQNGIKEITTGIGKGVQDAAKTYSKWYNAHDDWFNNPWARMVWHDWNNIKTTFGKIFSTEKHTGGGGGRTF